MKNFFKSPKKTAILGLIGSVIMLPSLSMTVGIQDFLMYLYVIGLIIYFTIILIRIYKKEGNIKIANYILITSVGIQVLLGLVSTISNVRLNSVIYLLVYSIITVYLITILLNKKYFINNKFFSIVIILYVIYELIRLYESLSALMGLTYINGIIILAETLKYLGYLFVIPYFYNYYNLLKGENKNGK